MPFFSFIRFHSHFCSVAPPCRFGWPAKVAATSEALFGYVERNFVRQWRLMNSSVFWVLSWALALSVRQSKNLGNLRRCAEDEPQVGKQFAAFDFKKLLLCSNANSGTQDLPCEGAIGSPSPAEFPELALFLSGGICAIDTIEQTPEIVLDSWQCFEVQLPGLPGRTRHFAGSNARHWHGQVSSAIVAMDPATRRCTTSSGRVYQLGESNGLAGNGEYTWHQCLRINQATGIVDVTDEMKKMLARHS